MAILDIVSFEGVAMEHSFSRGNVGVLSDVQGGRLNEFALPTLGGVCDYPSEDDVRFGVAFDVYTGNLELPAEADVLTGVQYGANGVEFTGNAAGGGGDEVFFGITAI